MSIAVVCNQLAVLSHGEQYPDFTPTGHIRPTITNKSQCPSQYREPNCTGCPDNFDIPECDWIVNCRKATPEEYTKAAFQFNTAQPENPDPCIIVMAHTARCIQEVVRKVKETRKVEGFSTLQIAIRGGRHSYIGASTVSKGIVIDVSRFNYVRQDSDGESMTVGAGITLCQLYYQLWNSTPTRLLYPGGSCPTVGLSGLTLGGGQGVVGRKYGLSADQVIEAHMVNSTGEVMIISETSNEDLYWALRGGGNGNFGIVYQFKLKRYAIPEMNTDYLIYFHNSADWRAVIHEWQKFITSPFFRNHHEIWSQLTVTPIKLQVAVHIAGNVSETDSLAMERIEALTKVPGTSPSGYYPNTPYTMCSYTPNNYSGSIAFWAGCTEDNKCGNTQDLMKCLQIPTDCGGEPFRMNSGYQREPLTDMGIQTIIQNILAIENVTGCSNASIQLDTLGGKINISRTSTAFPHRNNIITYQFLSYFYNSCNKTAMIEWQDSFHKSMLAYMTQGAYRNYANLDLSLYNERYYMENLQRLKKIKAALDPDDLFSCSQCIKPLSMITPSVRPMSLLIWHYLPYVLISVTAVIFIFQFCRSRGEHLHQE